MNHEQNEKERRMDLEFPIQLDRVKKGVMAQTEILRKVAAIYADALEHGGLVYVYANGHSRVALEEMVVRMGALTGFHPLLNTGLANFTDVVGANGVRMNQAIEKVEGLGDLLLDEYDFGPHDVLLVVSATGTTSAAVDMALAYKRRYPNRPLIALCSAEQAQKAAPKHSSGKTLYHVLQESNNGILLDNCMPYGDLSVVVEGQTGIYHICPLSSVGAITIVQSLNELTIRELDRRGVRHHVLRNMHLDDTQDSYELWIRDQRQRYARALHNPDPV
jgi:uncharacterized phosphosugar-binding protein